MSRETWKITLQLTLPILEPVLLQKEPLELHIYIGFGSVVVEIPHLEGPD